MDEQYLHLGKEGRKNNSNSARGSICVSEFDPRMKTTKMQEELIPFVGTEALKDMIETQSIIGLDGEEAVQSVESTGNKSSCYIESDTDNNSDSDSDSVDELVKIVLPNCLLLLHPRHYSNTQSTIIRSRSQSHCNQYLCQKDYELKRRRLSIT